MDAFPWLARQGRTTAVVLCSPRALMGTLLCAGFMGIPWGVLSVPRATTSKASSKPLGSVDAADLSAVGLRKKFLSLDAAFNILRLVDSVRAERLLAELDAEVHLNIPDLASYTSYTDAATCAPTELADSTRVTEYLAPEPVATLLEPRVPSVHIVQVPHVRAAQDTIEIPQLQILENFVSFPATCSNDTYPAPAPVIEHVTVDTCAAPARLAPAPVIEYIAPSPAVSYPSFYPSFSQTDEPMTNFYHC